MQNSFSRMIELQELINKFGFDNDNDENQLVLSQIILVDENVSDPMSVVFLNEYFDLLKKVIEFKRRYSEIYK